MERQSDPGRIESFNTVLREAAEQVQIVVVTCRPHELLAASELAASGTAQRTSGNVHAVNLTEVIRRFAPAQRAEPNPRWSS